MQLILRSVKQKSGIRDRQVVSIQQDHFGEASSIQGKCLEGIALYVGWFVMGGVGGCCGIYTCDLCEVALQDATQMSCLSIALQDVAYMSNEWLLCQMRRRCHMGEIALQGGVYMSCE